MPQVNLQPIAQSAVSTPPSGYDALFIDSADGFLKSMNSSRTVTAIGSGGAGTTWLNGSGAPTSGGSNGDYYLDDATGNVYRKLIGAWGSPIACIMGATGAAGSNGTNGTNGSTWYNGTATPPPSGTGVSGDYYLNTSTGAVYNKTSGGWGTAIMTLSTGSGSGGGSGSGPSVTSTSPGGMTTMNSRTPTITFNMSESIDPTTVNGTNCYLNVVAGPSVASTAAVSGTGSATQITITPNAELSAFQNYQATLTTGVQDTDGNPLVVVAPATSYVLQFETGS